MANAPPIPKEKRQFNQEIHGAFGEFGSSSGLQAFYVQAAISTTQLRQISLISDLRGSERWPVRELFQREVDQERVKISLMKYLEDPKKIKFFNPLTLTILPMSDDGSIVNSEMPKVAECVLELDGRTWKVLDRRPFYRFRYIEGMEDYGVIEWNDQNSRLVAIDGQHRLTALKRLQESTHNPEIINSFTKWRIPVVLVSFRTAGDRKNPPTVLEVIRSIFIYINTEAKQVSESRRILLSDESIDAVCTQELLDYSHKNDLKPTGQREANSIPLLAYDWRGEESNKNTSTLLSVVEINSWFGNYILGEDSTDCVETLFIEEGNALARSINDSKGKVKLSYEEADEIRNYFNTNTLLGLAYLLENFQPFSKYIKDLRALENTFPITDDITKHAFDKLRFGGQVGMPSIQSDIEKKYDELSEEIGRLIQQNFSSRLLSEDIGMRGVIWAFGQLHKLFVRPDWLEFSKWFTDALNLAFASGWFDDKKSNRRKYLKHVVFDHDDRIVNYRTDDASKAFGPFVQLLVFAYGGLEEDDKWFSNWIDLWDDPLDRLKDTLKRGYKRELKPGLKKSFPQEGKPLTAALNKAATKAASEKVERLHKFLYEVWLSGTPYRSRKNST